MARPFQSASTLSSQPGRTRLPRAFEQLGAQLRQLFLLGWRKQVHAAQPVQDVGVLPIAGLADAVDFGEERAVLRAEHLDDLRQLPNIELALLAFGIGVIGRGKAAIRRDHLAEQPFDGFGNAGLQERMPPLLPHLGHQIDQQRIVVEHLLEMRHQPALIHGIAGKAAAEMVVDAALADMQQRLLDAARRSASTP